MWCAGVVGGSEKARLCWPQHEAALDSRCDQVPTSKRLQVMRLSVVLCAADRSGMR